MAALTAPRDSKEHSGREFRRVVLNTNVIYKGAIVGVNAAGTAQKAAAGVTMQVMGIALQTVTGNASGTNKVDILAGSFEFHNSTSGDLIENDDAGKLCYAADDQTAALTATGSRPVLGRILGIADTGKVIVKIGPDVSFADAT